MNNTNSATLTTTDFRLGTLGTARRDYWLCQLAGWGSLGVVAVLSSSQGSAESVLRFALANAC